MEKLGNFWMKTRKIRDIFVNFKGNVLGILKEFRENFSLVLMKFYKIVRKLWKHYNKKNSINIRGIVWKIFLYKKLEISFGGQWFGNEQTSLNQIMLPTHRSRE